MGVMYVTDLPSPMPVEAVQAAFDALMESRDVGAMLNEAYPQNLVYKDSFADPNTTAAMDMSKVDQKRVLDLSESRLEAIRAHHANKPSSSMNVAEHVYNATLAAFWHELDDVVKPKITRALADAVGSEEVVEDAASNYRMIDYYQRARGAPAPRCGEHRDFGSYTLIFAPRKGLQVKNVATGEWMDVPVPKELNTAVLVFGWCTQIRSNDRLPAVLHRVVDEDDSDGVVPRRTSCAFFVAPKNVNTPLTPVVRDDEVAHYVPNLKAGQLRGNMARKWKLREGTLKPAERMLEEEEVRTTGLASQDDFVRKHLVVA